MSENNLSRRNFLRINSLAGVGLALSQAIPFSALANNLQTNAGHKPVRYFDAFTCIGPRKYKHLAEPWKLSELISEMEHCSVSGALVSYTMSTFYDAMYSNLELSNMLKPYSHLFAVWNVMPALTNEFPSAEELGRKMQEHNVRAVSIHPATNGWNWKATYQQDILRWLNEQQVLTIIQLSEIGDWQDLEELLLQFPKIPVLITGVYWSDQRNLIPMMENHSNLHCTFDCLQNMYGIEYMYSKGLVKQMVFGTNAPIMSVGAHRTFIDYAEIPEDARALIAGGNLTRLLKGQQPEKEYVNKQEDELMAAIRHGRPVPSPIIDMHMHMLHEGMNGAGWSYTMENGDPKGVFALTKKLGYAGGGFMSWNGVVSVDTPAGNITTGKALDIAPPGYWGLANFDPTHYTQNELSKMIPALYEKDARFIGMKPYHYIGVNYDDPSWEQWWKYGNDHHFYALLHSQRGDMGEYETLAAKYKNVRWLVAHSGQSYDYADKVIAAIKKFPNIYAEITLTSVPSGIIDYLVAGAGADKVLYGSDLPMRDPRPQLGWVVFSRLPVAIKRKVLGENAMQVIKPCMDRLPKYNRPVINNK
ncbi:Predicted metal-dependent hydrolase, TIM-barrel fold [Chitinophaga ginsengisegetis]|uniref:Predicted metal-dependent hydrolase, TIM-barrel fold n=1 Tax=Chitinophaga ginsengisegetis TaxID=393003 RepID=A0A1T5PCL3_9BACT|nr:amidohydrolase family protein [Chitinophaga ginsengisegetis]SKD10009.1 Predicted metal-dependent hydrolase, TIM-barrel fold [Chitinophaga ginsengisegetis]